MSVNEWLTLAGIVSVLALAFGGWMWRIDRIVTRSEVSNTQTCKTIEEMKHSHQSLSTEIWNRLSQHTDQIGGLKERVSVLESRGGGHRQSDNRDDRPNFFGPHGS